jgi:hypothetical protein
VASHGGAAWPQGKADLPFEDRYRLSFGFSESGLSIEFSPSAASEVYFSFFMGAYFNMKRLLD